MASGNEAGVLADLDAAVSEVLHRHGEMHTKFVAVIETIDSDGVRAVWTAGSPGISLWDMLGLLAYGQLRQSVGEDE